jgi:hypothetical protein
MLNIRSGEMRWFSAAALLVASIGLVAFSGCPKKDKDKGPIGLGIPSFTCTVYSAPVAGFPSNGLTASYAVVGFFWGNNGTALLVFTQDDLSGNTHLYSRSYSAGGVWGPIGRIDDDPTAFASAITVTPSNGSANVWVSWSRNGFLPVGRVYQFVTGWGPLFSNDFTGLAGAVFRQDGTILTLAEVGLRIIGYRLAFGSSTWEFMNNGNPVDIGIATRDYSVEDFQASIGGSVLLTYSDDNDNIFVRGSDDNGATWKTNHAVGGSLSLTTFDNGSALQMFSNGNAWVSLMDSTTTNQVFYAFYTQSTDAVASASITVTGVNNRANNFLKFPGYAAARDRGMAYETFTDSTTGGIRPYGFSYTHSATGIAINGIGDLTGGANAGNSVSNVVLQGNATGVTFIGYRQFDTVATRLFGVRFDPATSTASSAQVLDTVNPTDTVDVVGTTSPEIVFFGEIRNTAYFLYRKTAAVTTNTVFTFACTPWDASSATAGTSVLLSDITKVTATETAARLTFIPDSGGKVLINFHETFSLPPTDHTGSFGIWDSTTATAVSRQRITRSNPAFGVTNPPSFHVDLFAQECSNIPGGTGTSVYRQIEDDGNGFRTPMFAEN